MERLYDVLRAAPIGCGRYNNIDWPCGVVVCPIGCWATLGSAYVVTTRAVGAFAGPLVSVEALAGGDAAQNAQILRDLLEGKQGPQRDVVLLNAAAALAAGGLADDMAGGSEVARESIDSGRARQALERLVEVSNA